MQESSMGSIRPVKGARDFYPEDLAFRRWLYEQIRAVSERFGYQEYDGPFLERLDLYAARSGEELVKEQSFVFPDRGGELIALRPELTPSPRMVAARRKQLTMPLRWWSFGPFWRYERPQRGRSREFFQWNIDLLGIASPAADAELAAVAAAFFAEVGLSPEQVRIQVNDRRLAEEQLAKLGVPEDRRPAIFRLMDRRDRLSDTAWRSEAESQGISPELLQGLQAMLEDRQAWRGSEALTAFFEAAQELGAGAYLSFDPNVIRGLDYYTGIVFEARDASGRIPAILGGGRQDDLVSAAGDPIPALICDGRRCSGCCLPSTGRAELGLPSQVLVVTFDAESQTQALRAATRLRAEGLQVEWYPSAERLARQLKYADRLGIPLAVILGPDEIREDALTLKDLRSGEQERLPASEAGGRIRQLLLRQD
jgi:histidyl-tRNA synthetase